MDELNKNEEIINPSNEVNEEETKEYIPKKSFTERIASSLNGVNKTAQWLIISAIFLIGFFGIFKAIYNIQKEKAVIPVKNFKQSIENVDDLSMKTDTSMNKYLNVKP